LLREIVPEQFDGADLDRHILQFPQGDQFLVPTGPVSAVALRVVERLVRTPEDDDGNVPLGDLDVPRADGSSHEKGID
jgi:hypothetical protein